MFKRVVSPTESVCVEMMGLMGMGNNRVVGATVAPSVAVYEAMTK